ncbi:MAG TPA: hypothetical protein VN176_01255 [Verrucomicrobiae bacterium]|jgi:hypothetical protein|nr:hypothetical protein [Verrucomicrobiae bacterium]
MQLTILGVSRLASVAVLFPLSFFWAACAQTAPPVGELFPIETDARGPAVLAGTGMAVGNGSQLAAGEFPALLRLARGGQVRICPQSGLSVNTVPGNDGLLLSMNTGGVEINYALRDFADTLVTPDFRVLLAGPGTFHFAVGVNGRGDTCIKPMAGNTARVIVSEMFGSGTYQVKEDEAIVFVDGKLGGRASLTAECGCPAAISPALRASDQPASQPAVQGDKPASARIGVGTPFVFSARGASPPYTVARVNLSSLPNVFSLQEKVQPGVLEERPPEVSVKSDEKTAEKPDQKEEKKEKKKKKGFFGRVFGAIFGG